MTQAERPQTVEGRLDFDEALRWFGWPRESVCDMPWPAACKNCNLVTEDPDAYFYPPGTDVDSLTYDAQCYGTGDVHEPMTWPDFVERAKRWTAYVMRMERETNR